MVDKPSQSSQHRARKERKEAAMAQMSKNLTPTEVKCYNNMKDLKELSLLSAEIPLDTGRKVEMGLVGVTANNLVVKLL